MLERKKVILVTGSHRSGSTWLGKMLALSPGVRYIWEPFNLNNGNTDLWFQYVTKENEHLFLDRVKGVVYPSLKGMLMSLKKRGTTKKKLKIIRNNLKSFDPRAKNLRPILKDPIALFSAPWVAEVFSAQVVILIRHPAAFISSIKIKNWQFDFNNFLKQPLLMKEVLHEFESEIIDYAENKRDIIDQGCLLWRIFHKVILGYQKTHPEWLFIRHEDASSEPNSFFRSLYDSLELSFDKTVETKIQEATGVDNPGEIDPTKHIFKRNSKANIYNWKKRLTEEEISRIRASVESISKEFYDDSEW